MIVICIFLFFIWMALLRIIDEYRDLNRNEYFYLPGRILHLDGDKEYLDKCMSFYKCLQLYLQ